MTSSPSRLARRLRRRVHLLCHRNLRWVLATGCFLNILLLWWLYRLGHWTFQFQNDEAVPLVHVRFGEGATRSSSNEVTVLVREFEDFDNAVAATVASVLHILPGAPVVVVADKHPYPPLKLPPGPSVRLITLQPLPDEDYLSNHLERVINTNYVLILPDGAMITKRDHVQNFLVGTLRRSVYSGVDVVAVGLSSRENDLACVNLTFSTHRWTLTRVGEASPLSHPHDCRSGAVDELDGEVALFMKTTTLLNFSRPMARPFLRSFNVQSALRGLVVRLESRFRFGVIRTPLVDAHNRWKHKTLERERKKELYRALGIKREVYQQSLSDSSPSSIEWFGCTRESSRCFPTIVDDENPSYVEEGRWTPPCCLEKLRETTRHVVAALEKAGVRYWLEGGSLLGAARNGDIIPWDYDVDFGIYLSDFRLCRQLVLAWEDGAHEDADGFVWERARENDFFRVQYSRSNRLHVDLFPFYLDEKRGVMTKDYWMPTHRQDVEFPERFLLPMSRIPFAGISVAAPNDVRQFLELKFGKGVVENPRYPRGVVSPGDVGELLLIGKERPLLNGN